MDTNVISELQKGQRTDKNVQAWFDKTAEHDLIFVTRNVQDVERSGVSLLNPFADVCF